MTPDEWRQVDWLFAEALGMAPAERTAFLDRSCPDVTLRREVESLLEHSTTESLDFRAVIGKVAAMLPEKAAEPVPRPAPRNLIGQMLGPYRVVSLIGKGGMGEVYTAEDSRLGRQVALKLLPPWMTENTGSIRRFQQEARATSALNHPNIVTVHDFGQSSGAYYIATELVVGRTLREIISREQMPLAEIVRVALQIAEALGAAHAAGIIHRDIKPENVMVRPDGYVKVLDFGLAKLHQPETLPDQSQTNTGPEFVMGTARYMSPERLHGLEIDGRSDLFSLGVVLYEMVAQRCPFPGETPAHVMTAILDREPEPITKIVPQTPPQLESIIAKCLRKDRDRRYQTAQDLAADLRQLKQDLEGYRTTATPLALPARKKRKPLALALGAAAVLAVSFGAYRWMRSSAPSWYESKRLTRIPGSGPSNTGVLSPDGRYIAYVTFLSNGTRSLSVRLLSATSALELIPPAAVTYPSLAFSPDGTYLYYVLHKADSADAGTLFRAPVPGGSPQKLLDNVSGKLAASPDGTALAFVRRKRGEGTLSLANPDGSGERQVLRRQAEFAFQSVDWSPDGREIFFAESVRDANGTDCRIYSVSREGGEPRVRARVGKAFIYDLAVLHDGSGFLANAFDTEAGLPQIWHVSPTGTLHRITQDLSQYQGLSVTRDGKRILSSHAERLSELWLVDRDNPAAARIITEPVRRFDTPTWARDGNVIAARFEAGKWLLWAISPEGGAHRAVLPNPMMELEPHACPDRDEIVFVSAKADVYSIWRVRSDGSNLKQLTSGPGDRAPYCVAGGVVLYRAQAGGKRVTMQMDLDGATPAAPAEPSYQSYPQFVSPDGRLVLSTYIDERSHEERIDIRAREGGASLVRFPYGGRAVAWSPDSRGFADARGVGLAQEIWYQPVPSGAPKQLTRFGKDLIFALSWSPDGRQLVCARGRFISDMVLIEGVK